MSGRFGWSRSKGKIKIELRMYYNGFYSSNCRCSNRKTLTNCHQKAALKDQKFFSKIDFKIILWKSMKKIDSIDLKRGYQKLSKK